MLKLHPWMARLLAVTPLALALTAPAYGQIGALRNSDDQFIQGLREQGMSDLLERFVETEPPEDPIAQLALKIALQEFVADDLLARVREAVAEGDIPKANELFAQSREAFEQVLDAQRDLVSGHKEDERLPIWQTDLAEMLLFRYLPRYYQNVDWHYEFGQPTDEQAQAYEAAVVEALVQTNDAAYRLDQLASRVNQDGKLRPKLEEIGIWYRLEDFGSLNTPYWLAQAAHGVSLIPDDHPYFSAQNVRNQKVGDVPAERKRLRYLVVDSFAGPLIDDPFTSQTARLISGRTLVWSSDPNDIEEGVAEHLEVVIEQAANQPAGYLATLGKAVGRWKGGDVEAAELILRGIHKNKFVQADTGITTRLLAADLLFRILTTEAKKAPADKQQSLIAEAYEKAYVPLVGGDQGQPFRNELFKRWASQAGDIDDPMALPAMVRMGIGEQLTNQSSGPGSALVQTRMATNANDTNAIDRLSEQRDAIEELIEQAITYNQTLIGDEMQGPVLARGLYNLGMNLYILAELGKAFENQGKRADYLQIAKHWLAIGQRVPDADNVEQALTYAMSLAFSIDALDNKKEIKYPEARDIFRQSFELLSAQNAQATAVQDQRVYAGFHLYEKDRAFDQALECYGALPSTHLHYYQARRQMMYVLQRQYRAASGQLRVLEAAPPLEDAPAAEQNAWLGEKQRLEEDLIRLNDRITQDAQLLILDAEDEIDNGRDRPKRFDAATAMGAAIVVLAGVEAENGNAPQALDRLKGFEEQFALNGPFGQLAALQAQPDGAKANLKGLIQSAQEQRILVLLGMQQINEMADQAKRMMQETPDFASGVVNGVVQRIKLNIDRERIIKNNAPFKRIADEAETRIQFQAKAAIELSMLLLDWAKKRNLDNEQMVAYRIPLAEAHLLANDAKAALAVAATLEKQFPNEFNILDIFGKANIELYKQNKKSDNYNAAMKSYGKIIAYYNARPDKPAEFWNAWLQVITLLDAAGGAKAKEIPEKARILVRVDPEFGGVEFKDRIMAIVKRNGGVERLPNQN